MAPDDGKTRRLTLQCAKCSREIINPQVNEHVSYCSECRTLVQADSRKLHLKITLAAMTVAVALGIFYQYL